MAIDKAVDSSVLDAGLTSVANAIRTKGGTSASLAFPTDFVSAIGAIQTPLKWGVLRPDAEVVKTFSYDKWIHADEEVTIPSYTTTDTTLKATSALSETYSTSLANYHYYILERFLTYPTYSLTSKAKGRFEWAMGCVAYEVVTFPASTFKAFLNDTAYASRSTNISAVGNPQRAAYWSGTSTVSVATASYGTYQAATAPTISSGVITFNTPVLKIRGSTTYLTNTYFNAIQDIRYQWIIELYRAPRNNLGLDGWGQTSQAMHVVECAYSSDHKLT